MSNRTVFITPSDSERLKRMLDSSRSLYAGNHSHLSVLRDLLDEARLVPARDVPRHVIALNSRVRVRNLRSGKKAVYTLVFSKSANDGDDKISVLTPMGSALLGHKVGDVVEYQAPGGATRLKIDGLASFPGAMAA